MKFHEVSQENKKYPSIPTTLPTRATARSAGFDIFIKQPIKFGKKKMVLAFTDVKCELADDEVLLIYPRSSLATKLGITLANVTGVIDADYYNNPDNEGNIIIALQINDIETKRSTYLKAGTRVAQGVVVKYQTDDTMVETQRTGGLGSTGK